MQGSFPNGTPSTNRQDSNRHDRSIVNGGYARRQYISARPNLHNVPPNASYELQDGSRSSSRLWQFSPSMVPDRHEGFSADNEAASSPPPDAANKHAHPEGTSTAAAYNSPLLHTAKTAQRRFKPNTLYEEYDQRPYINDTEGTPTVANRPSLQTYRSHSSAKIHLIPRDNDHVYAAVPPSAALKDNHPKPANRYLSQALPLLPLPLQRLWRRQRKKSSSSDIHRIVGRPQSARANSRLGLVLVVCMSLVVFVWLLRHAKTTPAENRAPEEDSGANVSEPAKALVPTWKWWSPPQQTVASKPKKGRQSGILL